YLACASVRVSPLLCAFCSFPTRRSSDLRVLFNAILPRKLQFRNEVMKKKTLSNLVFESYRHPEIGLSQTVEFLDRLRQPDLGMADRKSTRLNSSHSQISYAVFCLKKKKY